jgi:hypothetical protein
MEMFQHSVPTFHNKLQSLISRGDDDADSDAEQLFQIARDIVNNNKDFFTNDFQYQHFKEYIGNDDNDHKISKEDVMNFAGYAYDEYIKEREDDGEAQEIRSPERASGKHRKRSAKLRRSMKRGKMKSKRKKR